MALIICPECGKSVSDKATVCPHCGYPLNNSNTQYDSDITGETITDTIDKITEKIWSILKIYIDAFNQFFAAYRLFNENGALDGGDENIQEFFTSEGKFMISLKDCITLLASFNKRIKTAREQNYYHPIRDIMITISQLQEYTVHAGVMGEAIKMLQSVESELRTILTEKHAGKDFLMAHSVLLMIISYQKEMKDLYEELLNIGATWV